MSETTKRHNPDRYQAIPKAEVDREWRKFQQELAARRFKVRMCVAAILFAGMAGGLLLWMAIRS